jgi:hypothetical protein
LIDPKRNINAQSESDLLWVKVGLQHASMAIELVFPNPPKTLFNWPISLPSYFLRADIFFNYPIATEQFYRYAQNQKRVIRPVRRIEGVRDNPNMKNFLNKTSFCCVLWGIVRYSIWGNNSNFSLVNSMSREVNGGGAYKLYACPGPRYKVLRYNLTLPYLTTPLFTYDVLGGKQTTHHNMVGYRYAWDKKRVHMMERKGSRLAIEQELMNETARAIKSEKPNKPKCNLY